MITSLAADALSPRGEKAEGQIAAKFGVDLRQLCPRTHLRLYLPTPSLLGICSPSSTSWGDPLLHLLRHTTYDSLAVRKRERHRNECETRRYSQGIHTSRLCDRPGSSAQRCTTRPRDRHLGYRIVIECLQASTSTSLCLCECASHSLRCFVHDTFHPTDHIGTPRVRMSAPCDRDITTPPTPIT